LEDFLLRPEDEEMKHEAVWASFGHKLFGREETAEPRKCHRTGEAESSTEDVKLATRDSKPLSPPSAN